MSIPVVQPITKSSKPLKPGQEEDEKVVLAFRCRLANASRIGGPSRHFRVNHVEFSATDSYLMALSQQDEESTRSAQRVLHTITRYDVLAGAATQKKLTGLASVPPMLAVGHRVMSKGIVCCPTAAANAADDSGSNFSLGSALGLSRSKSSSKPPKPTAPEYMAICHDTTVSSGILATTLDSIDVVNTKREGRITKIAIQPPLAWSRDGSMLAGLSSEETTEILVVGSSLRQPLYQSLSMCIPGHLAEVTQIAFMPDGQSLVSLAKDGVGRLVSTSLKTPGKLLKSFKVSQSYQYPASLLQVSPSGRLVVSVWGRQVVLWYPEPEILKTYNLDDVRLNQELWPLAISPDCELLVCRTENGIDISELATGKYKGHLNWARSFATAISFSRSGKILAVGLFNGEVNLYDVYTDETAPLELDSLQQPAEMNQSEPRGPLEMP